MSALPIFSIKKIHVLAISAAMMLTACAHDATTIQPSNAHIDAKVTAKPNENTPTAQSVAAEKNIPKPITKEVYLPPPKPTVKPQTYSVVVYDTPVKEVLFAIARDSKLNIDIHPDIHGNVTLNAVDQTLPAILKRLTKQVDLTYKIENNVLSITPDRPTLRSYKIDYVNMSRDTKGFIGADGKISSTSQSTGTGGTINTSTGADNSSRTTVDSAAKNHLWETLIQNIKDLLNETDKEVMVSKFGSSRISEQYPEVNDPALNQTNMDATVLANAERSLQQEEYKTLFAAKVIANPETGVISVRATNQQHERVQEFIDQVMGSAKRQVLIEATIVEVSLSDGFQTGIDWSRLGNSANSSGFTFQQSLGPTIDAASTGFSVGYINPVSALGSIASSITLLEQFGDTKVLSSPKLMVLNNQTAVLKVVDNLVYFTVQVQNNLVANAGSSNTVTTIPNTVPVGIVMSVTPQISDLDMVNINVRPTISRKIADVVDPNPSLQSLNVVSRIPVIQVREMESMLQVQSGNTAVLGGLMEDTIQKNTDQVPGISKVPVVGEAFKGRDDLTKKTELVIFLRPTVIRNASLESDELENYQQFLPEAQLKPSSSNHGER